MPLSNDSGLNHLNYDLFASFTWTEIFFSPLHMWTVPLKGSSMCWRWRHQACRCSFICHFILIYCVGQDRPPWAVVFRPGMLWCGETGWTGTAGSRELDRPGETCCPCPLDHRGLQKALDRARFSREVLTIWGVHEEVFDYLKGTKKFQDSIWSSGILHKSSGGSTDT